MVDFDLSYRNPYELILSDDFIDNRDMSVGDPVSLDFSDGEDTWSAVATVEGEGKLNSNFNKEVQSLFYILSNISSEEAPEELQNEWEYIESHTESEQVESIQEISQDEELRQYIHSILHYLRKRAWDTDVLIGPGYLCHTPIPRYDWESLLKSPYVTMGRDILSKSNRPELKDISKIHPDAPTPDTVYFCTNRIEVPDAKKEDIRRSLEGKYLDQNLYHLFGYNAFPIHGPVIKEEYESDIILIEDCSISFLSIDHKVLQFENSDIDLQMELGELLNEFEQELQGEVKDSEQENGILIDYEFYDISLSVKENSIFFDIRHAENEEIDTARDEVKEISDFLDDEVEGDMRMYSPSEPLPESTHKQTWVLDTNSLYRQRSTQGSDQIAEFVAENKVLHNKKIKVPWQVLVEINRHKDARRQTRTASEQGIQNIEVIKSFSDHGFLN